MSEAEGALPIFTPRKRDVLSPQKDKIHRRKWVVFDIESKKKDTADKGFERPFLACFYDGEEYQSYRNDARHHGRSYVEGFWHEPGGCIDGMMRFILGLRECAECEIGPDDYKWGSCKACTKARRRYQGKKCMITAHNGGNFDNLFVMGWIRRHAELFCGQEIVNVQSRMLILTFKPRLSDAEKGSREKWTFTDSITILPLSLKEIGKTFCADNPDVQKMNFDLDLPEEDPRWDEYNRRDCLVLLTALNRFRALVERLGGAVGMTAASTAMSLLRRKFMTKPIERNSHFPDCDGKCRDPNCPIDECRQRKPAERECHGCLHAFVRDGFFGGRTEPYRMRGWNLIYADVNSSYPTAMLGDMPIGKARVLREGATLSMLRSMGRTYQGFVECVIEVPKSLYLPPLPYRLIKKSGEMKLVFPTGRLYGTWAWIEIEHALSMGCRLKDVGKSVWFQKGKLFDKMVRVLYGYRQKKCKNEGCGKDVSKGLCKCPKKTWDAGLDFVAKLMMNSSFGKFATNPIREKTILSDEIPLGAKVPPPWMKDAPFRVQHILKADYIIPHIAAWITADARLRLHKGLLSVLERGGQINYADSVTGERCVPVMAPDGHVKVLPIEELFGYASEVATRLDGKETGFLSGWKTLARDKAGREGWFEIGCIIRHKTDKQIHLVSTRYGQSRVTEDHGIIVEGREVTPMEFVAKRINFEQVKVPASGLSLDMSAAVEELDLKTLEGEDGKLPDAFMDMDRASFRKLWVKLGGEEEAGRAFMGEVLTGSLRLASQLSYLFSRHVAKHWASYLPRHKLWLLKGFSRGKKLILSPARHEVEPGAGRYVYDLNVPDAGTFVDALGNVLLHNTDSSMSTLMVQPEGLELGQWKVEDSHFSYESLLPKMYMLCLHEADCKDAECRGCRVLHKKIKEGTKNQCADDELCVGCKPPQKVAMKGVPKGSQRGDVFELLKAGGEVRFERLTKYRTMLRENMDSPVEQEASRSIQSEYDKRTILPDGDTRPLHMMDPPTIKEGRAWRAKLEKIATAS